MSGGHPMRCPECGEGAVWQPPADLVPWEAIGMPRPEWSHLDGTSLCPVIGPFPCYRPARPQPLQPGQDVAERMAPPATLRLSLRTDMARQLAGGPGNTTPALTAIGVLGRERSMRVMARLGALHRQGRAAEPEPEAGG